jgi:hypothetical protein
MHDVNANRLSLAPMLLRSLVNRVGNHVVMEQAVQHPGVRLIYKSISVVNHYKRVVRCGY